MKESSGPPSGAMLPADRRIQHAEFQIRHREFAYLVPRMLLKQELAQTDRKSDLDDATFSEDEIDTLLLRLMSLSEQYLLTPQTPESLNRELQNTELVSLHEASGEDLLEKYKALEERVHQLPDPPTENAVPVGSYRSALRDQILEVLRHPRIRAQYLESLEQERRIGSSHRKNLDTITETENLRSHAKLQFRSLRAHAVLDRESDGQHNVRRAAGITPEVAKVLHRVMDAAEEKTDRLERRLSDTARGCLVSRRLLDYKHQVEATGFAMTPSREALLDEIGELTAQGFRIFLGGPTGTGKTTLGVFALRQLTGGRYEVISWSGETTVRDVFGSPTITMTEKGMESGMTKGPYTRTVTGEARGVLQEELTSGATSVQLSLKALWASRSGDEIHLPGFNGYAFTKEQMVEIATGNLRGQRHLEREEMDPAIAREFKAIDVPFLPAEEMRDIILAELMDRAGFLPLCREDVEMVTQLCKAAELSQAAYLEQIPEEVKKSPLYQIIATDPSVDIRLTRVFMDSGTTKDLFAGWKTSGKPLRVFLRDQLHRFLLRNPHFSELKEEQKTLQNVLLAYGFNLEADSPEKFYRPIDAPKGPSPRSKAYLLPSELGFLIPGAPPSDEDEFGADRHTVTVEADEVEYESKEYRVTGADGKEKIFVPDQQVKTGEKTYIYLGIKKNGTPLFIELKKESETEITPLTPTENNAVKQDIDKFLETFTNDYRLAWTSNIIEVGRSVGFRWIEKVGDMDFGFYLRDLLKEGTPEQKVLFFQKLVKSWPNGASVARRLTSISDRVSFRTPYATDRERVIAKAKILEQARSYIEILQQNFNAESRTIDVRVIGEDRIPDSFEPMTYGAGASSVIRGAAERAFTVQVEGVLAGLEAIVGNLASSSQIDWAIARDYVFSAIGKDKLKEDGRRDPTLNLIEICRKGGRVKGFYKDKRTQQDVLLIYLP